MSIQIPVRVTSFMRVEFTTADHPELDRAITLPQTAPMEWIIDAYLLSIGREPVEDVEFGDDEEDYEERPRPRPHADTIDRWRMAMPALDHRPDVIVRPVDSPPLGAAVVAASASAPSPAVEGNWLTQAAPFREDDVNRELMRRHGVVKPYFDDSDIRDVDPRIRRSSRIATLLSGLTSARRLALLAHIDAVGLLRDSVHDRAMVATAVAPLAALLRHLGGTGAAQDPVTGWFSEADVERLTRAVGWNGGSDETRSSAETVISFARRAKLIRRFKGRVVATAYAKSLVQPSRGTLAALAGTIGASTRERYGMPLPRRDAEGGPRSPRDRRRNRASSRRAPEPRRRGSRSSRCDEFDLRQRPIRQDPLFRHERRRGRQERGDRAPRGRVRGAVGAEAVRRRHTRDA